MDCEVKLTFNIWPVLLRCLEGFPRICWPGAVDGRHCRHPAPPEAVATTSTYRIAHKNVQTVIAQELQYDIHCCSLIPKYCDEYVCLSVRSHNSKTTWLNFTNFCACCIWPCFGPTPTALRYVIYFQFCR